MRVGSLYSDAIRRDAELLTKLEVFVEGDTNWYHAWFFRMRLADEIRRASRYHHPFSLVLLNLESPPATTKRETEYFHVLLWEVAEETLQAPDVPGLISARELVVLLPETTQREAEKVANKLCQPLANYDPVVRIAEFPRDAGDIDQLWEVLRKPKPSNLVSLEDYRGRKSGTRAFS